MAPGGPSGQCVNLGAPAAIFFLFQFSTEDIGFHGDYSFGCCCMISVHSPSIPRRMVSSTSAATPRMPRERDVKRLQGNHPAQRKIWVVMGRRERIPRKGGSTRRPSKRDHRSHRRGLRRTSWHSKHLNRK